MCAVAAIPYVIAAIGTAYAIHSEGQQAKYQESVDDNNSKLAVQQASNANAQGSYAADQARIRGVLQRGQQVAGFAANNVDSSTGSAADILGDTAMFTAQDERQARINASQQAYGFQVQSTDDLGAAKYAAYSGKTQQISSFLNGASQGAGMASKGGLFNSAGGSTALTGGSSPSYYGGSFS